MRRLGKNCVHTDLIEETRSGGSQDAITVESIFIHAPRASGAGDDAPPTLWRIHGRPFRRSRLHTKDGDSPAMGC